MVPLAGRVTASALLLVAAAGLFLGCRRGPKRALHRERFAARDAECREPERPRAYMYPAENRTDYGPDDPKADRCVILVPDHLFCCPDASRPTDR